MMPILGGKQEPPAKQSSLPMMESADGDSRRGGNGTYMRYDTKEDIVVDQASVVHDVADEVHVHLSIHTGRMLAAAVCMAAILIGIVFTLGIGAGDDGLQLEHFERGLEGHFRDDKLEKLNSRSGSFMSAIQFPIKQVSQALLSVVILTFGKRFVMVANPSYETKFAVVAVSVVMTFLLTSGLTAISVNFVDDVPIAYMNVSDLTVANTPVVKSGNISDKFKPTTYEMTANNNITNTVLRTAVRPFKIRPPPQCSAGDASFIKPSPVTATFGFRMATWQSSVLQQALAGDFNPTHKFKIYMNKTKDKEMSANRTHFPMKIADANNLFINSLMFTYSWAKWWNNGIDMRSTLEKAFSEKFSNRTDDIIKRDRKNLTATEVFDLEAPPGVDKIDYFINRTRDLLNKSLTKHPIASYIASTVSFKSVNLTEDVTMDSVTFDVPMWKGYLNRKLVQDGDRLKSQGLEIDDVMKMESRPAIWDTEQEARTVIYELDKRAECGPLRPSCLVEWTDTSTKSTSSSSATFPFVPEHRIRAIGECLNADGTNEIKFVENVTAIAGYSDGKEIVDRRPSCTQRSNTSFFISGFSYRIVGDAMIDGPPPGINSSEKPELTQRRGYLLNPRKIYTLTVARISWKTVDLSERFDVKCINDDSKACEGLSFPTNTREGELKQFVVVGESRLPVHKLQKYDYTEPFYHIQVVSGVPLVATPIMQNVLDTNFTDYALSHNFPRVQWNNSTMTGDNCSRYAEKALVTNIDNHYYMEGTVQPVYTTALFFLFQDGERQTQVKGYPSVLDLDTKNEPVEVIISIPDLNAWMSIIGSILLLVACIGVWIQTTRCPDTLQQALTADTTVRVLMNEKTFPSILLQKTVISPDQDRVIGEGSAVKIDRVGLRAKSDQTPPTGG